MLIRCDSLCRIDVSTRVCASCSISLIDMHTKNKTISKASGVLTTTDSSDRYGVFSMISEVNNKKYHKYFKV